MQFHSNTDRNKIAYLGALTLLFSYAEMFLPRIIPFFRFGFGNIAILMALELNPLSFFELVVIKAFASSMMAGTLFSPFVLISLGQSAASGLVMYLLYRLNKICAKKILSVYGISVAGSVVSGMIQILLSSLYLGEGTFVLLGPIILFNTLSGIVTAYFSTLLDVSKIDEKKWDDGNPVLESENKNKIISWIIIPVIIILTVVIFSVENIYVLFALLVVSFVLQFASGRKFYFIPHLALWCFVIFSSIFVPQGKVIFNFWKLSLTEGALVEGVIKAIKLSAVSALSQCATGLKPSEKTLIGLSLSYFRKMSDTMRNSKGNIIERIKTAIM